MKLKVFSILQLLRRAIQRIIGADYYPFYHLDSKQCDAKTAHKIDDMDYIHYSASCALFSERHFFIRWLAKSLLLVTWPFRLVKLAFGLISQHGEYIESISGKKRLSQFFELLHFSNSQNVPPKAYYSYQFYLPEQKARASNYIFNHEVTSLFPKLNNYTRHKAVDDKMMFSKFCQQYQLPSVTTLGEFKSSRFMDLTDNELTEERIEQLFVSDIFIKPSRGFRGKGAMLWRRKGENCYRSDSGVELTKQAIIQCYKRKSDSQPYIMQARLQSHSLLSDLAGEAICSARVVTIRDKRGAVNHLCSALKIPYCCQITNNIGYFSAVDEVTGKLGRLYSYRVLCNGFEKHPECQIPVQGLQLPDWPETLKLALQAHRHFPQYFSLGWDIALTSQGPMLLEANSGWDVLTMQRAHQKPLGETLFKLLCVTRLKNA